MAKILFLMLVCIHVSFVIADKIFYNYGAGKRYEGTFIKSLTVSDSTDCPKYCYDTDKCRSYNISWT